ncbi:MAG: NAD(P)H-hydrate dehydratase, partial [Proteobacteria bacterium]|nr:NAD(P)H-hydrate dehydratase [Pseudomonadota bacterium]
GMEGAVAMSAMAALKSGAGLVTVVAINETTELLRQRMPILTPEIMISSIKVDDKTGSELMDDFKKFNSVVIGPGFGKKRKTVLKKILEHVELPLVIDADALNLISDNPDIFDIVKGKDAILTPHPGEMSRMLPEIKDVQDHRLRALEKYVKGQKFCLLLKGYRSMLGRGDGHVLINYTGNPSLSKGGSGDVLSGLIASFNAQGLEIWKAGALGMYIHGLCADRLVMEDKNSDFGILPTDIINELGPVIKCLTE